LEITFLGTGTSQGVPVIGCNCVVCRSDDPRDQRLRSSVMVKTEGRHLLIDAGPDLRQQLLNNPFPSLDGVLITHGHKDHIGGMDDLRAYNYLQAKPVDIYATENTLRAIRREYHYAFGKNPYPGIPRFALNTISPGTFSVNGVKVTAISVLHMRMHVMAFRIGDFTYITDCNEIPSQSMKSILGSRILVINALRREKHVSHFKLSEALEVIREIQPEQAFITHISHMMGTHAETSAILPKGVFPAYDGLTLRL
jgi:phosphoribosyl 1,2-cyclic phosphate phosphodiesterase